ncbi:Protein spartin [Diplonema papillatum]|nr:Protein spartin [Diplonema papillatum]
MGAEHVETTEASAPPLPSPTNGGAGAGVNDEREATILLQVDDVTVNEVKGQQRAELDKGSMTILKIAATAEELQELSAAMLVTDLSQENSEVVFIIVGEHKIPIIQNVPVLRKEPGRYTFVMPGLFLELAMPEDVDEEEIEILELLLRQHGVFRVKGERVVQERVVLNSKGERTVVMTTCDKISSGIDKAGQKVVTSITTVTPMVQSRISSGSEFARGKISRNETPTEIDDRTKAKIKNARMATRTAVVVSGQMATAMVNLARNLGCALADTVSDTPAGRGASSEKGQEARKVVGSGLVAAANVMDAGTDAIKAVITTTCDSLSEVVGHKYGDDAGATCSEVTLIVQDVVEAGTNVRKVGVRGLAKVAGKEAGKKIVNGGPPVSSSSPRLQ